ncbi:MAG: YfhO family protein [bacterium]|nr:YfhO family protein [bacterium]
MKQKYLLPLILVILFIALPFLYKLPIPTDTIPGLYWPMKDTNFGDPNGVPVKNPLITDPVRQQFAWKYLAMKEIKQGHWPLWNPYNFSGTPLLANFQTGAFYPGNVLFFIPNPGLNFDDLNWFAIQWSWYIYAQIALSVFFLYLYLKKIGLDWRAALFGGIVFAFSGFSVGWWEWGNLVHTLLWFPLILYCIESIIEKDPVEVVEAVAYRKSILGTLFTIDRNRLILLFALFASFTAGHLQTHILVLINTLFYILYKIPLIHLVGWKIKAEFTHRRMYYWTQLAQIGVLFILLIAVQALPTYEFLQKSARNLDPSGWQRKDWFYPFEHFITFLSPDYFGNPTTYNYWGVWNYGEFAGYVGIVPLIFALSVIIQFLFDKYKKLVRSHSLNLNHHQNLDETLDILQENTGTGFFLFCLFINLVLITRNPLTESFYAFNIPFLAGTQPSRGIAIVDFALVVLAAVGCNQIIKVITDRKKPPSVFIGIKTNINYAYLLSIIGIGTLWLITILKLPVFLGVLDKIPDIDVFKIARSNLILPTALIIAAFTLLRTYFKSAEKVYATESEEINSPKKLNAILIIVLAVTFLDLARYWYKFESFSKPEHLYPKSQLLDILKGDPNKRYQTEDSRILPPNMNIPYDIYTVEGYDPLYYEKYGQLIGMWDRNKADLTPYKANRIITPHKPKSIIANISGASHLLSFGDYTKYEKLDEYGMTKLFKIDSTLPHMLIFSAMRGFETDQQMADYIFSSGYDPSSEALFIMKPGADFNIPDNGYYVQLGSKTNNITPGKYTPTEITLTATVTDLPGLLYIADTFDEGWKASIDGNLTPIIRTNFAFRGIQLTPGTHEIRMWYAPDSFRYGLMLSSIGAGLTILMLLANSGKSKS